MDSQKKNVEKKDHIKIIMLLLIKLSGLTNAIFSSAMNFSKKMGRDILLINKVISPKQLILNQKAIYFISMFLFSFFVIACETLEFHMLSIVSNYLQSTTIISIALLGIALGGLAAYYFGKLNFHAVTAICGILTFISIIYSYYNIINVEMLKYPYFLILPFIFSSIVISTIFIHGNSNSVYFINLIASACGVIYPIILVPLLKSENCLFLLLLVPAAFFFVMSLRIANLILKLSFAVISILIGIQICDFIGQNMSVPDKISSEIYEKKILPEIGGPTLIKYKKNAVEDFLIKAYKKESDGNYVFSSDDYDLKRAEYILGRSGFINRYKIPFISFFEPRSVIGSAQKIPAVVFEQEVLPLISKWYDCYFDRNYDRAFFDRVLKPDSTKQNYVFNGSAYDLQRMKYLLAGLGHVQTVDMMFDIRPAGYPQNNKIYGKPGRVLLSEDSLLGRVEYTGDDDYMMMSINGIILDGIDNYNGAFYDPRIPHMDDAEIFIIGLSADGIVKSAKRLPGAKVSGIEINPVIMRTMQNGQFSEFARKPYENTEVFYGEGRSFLESTDKNYDVITLMNIHSEHSVISTLSPENFHTVEGTKLLLSRITDRGIIDYEEILGTERTEIFFLKFLNTVKQALYETGIKDPGKNIFIYRWGFTKHENVFRTVYVKKNPYTEDELNNMNEYIRKLVESGFYYNIEVLHAPDLSGDGDLEKFITGPLITKMELLPSSLYKNEFIGILNGIKSGEDMDFILGKYELHNDGYHLDKNINTADETMLKTVLRKAGHPVDMDLEPVTDDKPFPFNVYEKKFEVWNILYLILALSLILIIPVFFLVTNNLGKFRISLLKCILFTALTGFGFMLVEIVLMQKFQKFIGNPNYTLIAILGGILLFSGLGSFASRHMSSNVKTVLVFFIPALLLLKLFFLDDLFIVFAKYDFNIKPAISLCLIAPVGFLIGIPFPNALEVIKKNTSSEFAALLFGISGFFSTLASVISILINVSGGFPASFYTGIAFYIAGILIFIMIIKFRKA